MLNKLAQEIANITSEVIGHDVLITDQNGIVLGASDRSRIGTLHQASLGVIFRRKEATHNHMISRKLKGVKPGITLPIELAGKIIGTVGITGDPDEVSKFGMLVKKSTEILLREEIFIKSSLLRDRALQNLIQEIAEFDPVQSDEILLLTRGQELGYDLKLPRIAIVIDLFRFAHITKEIHQQTLKKHSAEIHIQSLKLDIESRIKKIFSHPQDIIIPIGSDKYVVLHFLRYEFYNEEVISSVEDLCGSVISELEELGIRATIGIGSIAKDLTQISESYHSAWSAISIAKRIKNQPNIFHIQDFYLEELLSHINKGKAKRFLEQTLVELKKQPDWEEMARTIRIWCESSLSPINASKQLNIHRNTLFYRLNKIQQITGLNLRIFREALTLYLAVIMTDLIEQKEE
jgi:carbohydrate diacid regulator